MSEIQLFCNWFLLKAAVPDGPSPLNSGLLRISLPTFQPPILQLVWVGLDWVGWVGCMGWIEWVEWVGWVGLDGLDELDGSGTQVPMCLGIWVTWYLGGT